MPKKITEKIPVTRFEGLKEEDVNPMDVDLNKTHSCLAGELKELAEHHDVMEDELGVILLDDLKHTIIVLVTAYHARLSMVGKIAGI